MTSEILVDLDHGPAEVFAIPSHGELSAGIRYPFGESFCELLVVPCQEKVAEFVVVHGVRIWGISNPKITDFAQIPSVARKDF